ncbi:GDP-mannose 4,6-dehydratase [Kineothrix sp. MB12-C1]|uniref:GDP-mannose 4,6-dehydratase n=1 Tax=Kineothrix sp. MB12-C1 TaxID=3070215 RepID=UPI0027D2860E|nr:GDP-mannose 4,6-dehydratase [Kineothrix sp. MB12-C1]WMC91712.1 GDP-mannose 4,6-dehydratase [Kineothrix sp. MB12-C1]
MKKALIIGAAGFVGSYLSRYLYEECGMEVYVTKLPYQRIEEQKVKEYDLNILEEDEIVSLLFEVRPDYIFHLAAQSSVGTAWKDPGLTIDINIKGSVNVMDAVRELYYKPRILLIGSGEEYGHIRPGEIPIDEETTIRPGNIYAATKACQNMLGSIYAQAYDMEIMMVRAFNHIGPAQAPIFVVSDFCKQVAEIEEGMREPVIYVGNLRSMRDFTDVRDVVRAYALLMECGKSGETYNVGSGNAVTIREVLDLIISLSDKNIEVKIDNNKIRPVDVPIIEADITKINELTGWKPEIPLRQTIKETLDYWRERV